MITCKIYKIECPYFLPLDSGDEIGCFGSEDQCYYWRYKKKASENPPALEVTIDDIILEKGGKKRIVEKEVKQNKMRLIEVEDEQDEQG